MVLEFFGNFFTNPFNLVMIALFILIGILIGLVFRPKAKNQVMKLIERDKRFVDFNIAKETAFSVECEPKKGFAPQRFIKLREAYTGTIGRFLKRTRTRFIGKEGTAYTWSVESGKKVIGSLAKALRGVWGDEFYFTVPEDKRRELEESKVNVTVELDSGFAPEDYPEIREEDIFEEEDRKGAETYWQGKKMAEKGTWMQWMFIFAAGMGAMAIASKLLGWW
jgi:hypothetical protein